MTVRAMSVILALAAGTLLASGACLAFDFTPGDFYATTDFSRTIYQYTSTGQEKSSVTLPSTYGYARGVAFGPDNLLYATVERGSNFSVLALDAAGAVRQTYDGSGYIAGNLAFGSIDFDPSGAFCVGGPAGVTRFAPGEAGRVIWNGGGVYSVEALPTGNLLVATDYDVFEIGPQVHTIREIEVSDPGGVAGGASVSFTNIRGLEYDPNKNCIFVTALGHTGFFDQLMRLECDSGVLLHTTTFVYGTDMFFTQDARLVVGSWTQSPGIFTLGLTPLGSFEGDERLFVTQFVPEPSALLAFAVGLVGLLGCRRRPRRT